MADNETIADIITEIRAIANEKRRANDPREYEAAVSMNDYADRFEAAHRRERGDSAKLREALEYPKDANDKYIHIGDAVHMLNTDHEGDHEWDDIVVSFEYVGKGGGDDWLVYGEDGAAWACECEVLKQEGGNDGK